MLECVCTSPSEQSSITLHHNQCEASIDQSCHVVKAFSSSSLTQKFLLAAYNRIFGKCWALQHERLQFWIYSHMCVALLGSILWQDPLSVRFPPTVSSVTFQASLTSQWTVGRRKESRGEGGHPHCSHDHALKLCAMTVSVFKWLEATREQRLGALELKINWLKVLDLVWHVTCKALLTVPNVMK